MSLKQVKYHDVIERISKCNPAFGLCLKEIVIGMEASGEKIPEIFIAEYGYGENIINAHAFKTPTNSDIGTEQTLFSNLSNTQQIPLIFILQNTSEVYVEVQPGIAKSMNLLSPGDLIGTYESVEFMQQQFGKFKSSILTSTWQALSGSQSVFLPILLRSRESSNQLLSLLEKHNLLVSNELEKYDFSNNSDFRNKIKDNAFPVMKAIADLLEPKHNWKTEVVIFSNQWISNQSEYFGSFHKYIYAEAWDQASFSIKAEAISSQLSSVVRFNSVTDNKILQDLTKICSNKTFAHEVLHFNDLQKTGPFRVIQSFLQSNLGYKNPPLIIHPVNIQDRMQVSEKATCYYSATFPGQTLSKEFNSTIDLTTSFFKPMERILSNPELLEYLSKLCGYKVTLTCYGRKRNKIKTLDNREIFNDLVNQIAMEQNIDYDHPYLRACIKLEFTKRM